LEEKLKKKIEEVWEENKEALVDECLGCIDKEIEDLIRKRIESVLDDVLEECVENVSDDDLKSCISPKIEEKIQELMDGKGGDLVDSICGE
jgi:uncharacterized membrane-anchored protein YjiN (DUF445 family)